MEPSNSKFSTNKNFVHQQENAREAKARHERIDVYQNVGKVQLVPGGIGAASNSKRGKSAGFYCNVCDMTFKDSIQYTDHLNSKQHLHTSGLKEHSSRASLEQVQNRLKMLRNKKQREIEGKSEEYDIKKRIAARKQLEEQIKLQRKERRKRRGASRQSQPAGEGTMEEIMGLSGFGSTKH